MEEQEKKKRIELEQDMSWKMYQILTITACKMCIRDRLNASEGQLEKGIGYLFGIREIAEKIPGFLPDIQ